MRNLFRNHGRRSVLLVRLGGHLEPNRTSPSERSVCGGANPTMIRVELPARLRTLAQVDGEVKIDVEGEVTQHSVLDALEACYPMLRGTIRDRISQQRRPFLRFFACKKDLSHEPPDTPLPDGVAAGAEPLLIIGALAGGREAPSQLHASSESDGTHSSSSEVFMPPSQKRKHRGIIFSIGQGPG